MQNDKKQALFSQRELTQDLIMELSLIHDKLSTQIKDDMDKLNNLLEKAERVNQNLEKRIEDTFLNNPHGIDLKYDIRFVRYALLTDFESVKNVLHVARKLDDRGFISWLAKQVEITNPEWTKDLNLKKVPFLKEVQDNQRKFDEICHQTIQKKKAQKSES